MEESTRYRETLYRDYSRSQGRFESLEKTADSVNAASHHLESEILPLLDVPSHAAVLDIGSGTGSMIAALKRAGYADIAGIDISEDQVALAHALGHGEVRAADAIPFLEGAENRYDLITGIDIIEHYTKSELVTLLTAAQRALRPGGQVIFRTPNIDSLFGTVFSHGDFTHECILNHYSAEELFTSLGYRDVRILPGLVRMPSVGMEMMRKVVWHPVRLVARAALFASGISARKVILEPNLIVSARRRDQA